MYIHIYIHLYTCIYASIFSFNILYYYRAIYIRMTKKIYLSFCYVFMYVCLYIYICLYLYVCIYVINIRTKKHDSIIQLQVLCHPAIIKYIYFFIQSTHKEKYNKKYTSNVPCKKYILFSYIYDYLILHHVTFTVPEHFF